MTSPPLPYLLTSDDQLGSMEAVAIRRGVSRTWLAVWSARKSNWAEWRPLPGLGERGGPAGFREVRSRRLHRDPEPHTQISVRIDDATRKSLKRAAKVKDVSVGAILRAAFETVPSKTKKKQ